VVSNLVSNAIKFTPQGVVSVKASCEGDHAVVRVSDNGCGITADFLPHVFEQFRQAGDHTFYAQGLGLGLAIVRHIVELHGGDVVAQSEGAGKGATFVVSLPLS
jgi:signal transduction histidine kinase